MSRLPIFLSTGRLAGDAPHCPVCQTPSDAWTRMGEGPGRGPSPGAVGICVYCSSIGVYALGPRGLILREPTEAERATFENDGLLELASTCTEKLRREHQQ